MVKLLLTANASTSVANDDHVTPVEVAKTPAIAQLLRAHAAANEDTAEMGGGSSSGGGRAGKRVRGTSTSGARLSKRSVEARGAKGDVSWSALGHAKGGTDWIGEFQFTQVCVCVCVAVHVYLGLDVPIVDRFCLTPNLRVLI